VLSVCFRPKQPIRKSNPDRKSKNPQEAEYDNKWKATYGGYIRKYRLCEWWDSTFSSSEKARVRLASGNKSVDGVNAYVNIAGWSAVDWLSDFALRRLESADLMLALKFLDQALNLIQGENIPKAFALHAKKIDLVYKASRGDEDLFPFLIGACEEMIEYSRPRVSFFKVPIEHVGYKRLYLHLDAVGEFEMALTVANDALNGGWLGDWHRRVARCQNRCQKKLRI
jgi:hypothetical protein